MTQFLDKIKEFEGITVVEPAVASLLCPSKVSPWPTSVSVSPKLMACAYRRQRIISCLDNLYEKIRNVAMDLTDAIDHGIVSESSVANLFVEMSDLLEDEQYGERLLLYFPIEFLPAKQWKPSSAILAKALNRFRSIFLAKWWSLLNDRDIRANFVDGDIPEIEIRKGPLPQVVKAAHLVPSLVLKGFLTLAEIGKIMDASKDALLTSSLNEAIIACDRVNAPTTSWSDMSRRRAKPVTSNVVDSALDVLQQGKREMEMSAAEHMMHLNAKPLTRINWEIKRDLEFIQALYAKRIASMIIDDPIRNVTALKQCILDSDSIHVTLISISCVQAAVETIAKTDIDQARDTYVSFQELIERSWKQKDVSVMVTIESMLCRLASIGVVNDSDLKPFGIKIPDLDGIDFMRDLSLINDCARISRVIWSTPGLSQYILPVTIEFGSRIKGYGSRSADWDIAVFIRPGTSITHRPVIQSLLTTAFEELDISGKALEFWLESSGDNVRIRDFIGPDRSLGDSTLTHVLLQGIWSGDMETIEGLYEKVLANYLQPKHRTVLGDPAQKVWLSEMERDVLQYRLMHTGYSRYHPEQKSKDVPDALSIDSRSTFWDPGYRRLATKLFLQKVFLPDLG